MVDLNLDWGNGCIRDYLLVRLGETKGEVLNQSLLDELPLFRIFLVPVRVFRRNGWKLLQRGLGAHGCCIDIIEFGEVSKGGGIESE